MPEHQFIPFLETILSPRRLAHSLGTMEVMRQLADIYGFDQDKAMTIGILHDAGKDLPSHIREELVKEANIQILYACEENYTHYLHGPVGAYFVQKSLGITDHLVLDAIRTHTFYGNSPNFHNPICWCMRFSDVLEPTRNWEDEELIYNLVLRLEKFVFRGCLDKAAYLQTATLIKWFEEKNIPIHPNMRRIKKELGTHLSLDDSYLDL